MLRRALLSTALLAPSLTAQISSTVGPPVAPLGSPIAISISNDTTDLAVTGICPYVVYDDAGAIVFTPFCPLIAKFLPPGDTFTATWRQIDNQDQPVPPGLYRVDVELPGGSIVSHDVVVDEGTKGAMALLGAPTIGTARNLLLTAPGQSGKAYLALASASTKLGIPTCGGKIPLDPDPVLDVSLVPDNGVFVNFFGALDEESQTTKPVLDIPSYPALAGFELYLGFVLVEPPAPCPFRLISEELPLTVQ